MLGKIWAALLAFGAITWFVDAIQVVFDTGYQPSKFTLVVAFAITGITVAKWAVEAWNEK